ncbi:uncharacterized protein LOC136043007, partial [Artemia franciscana]|uniref:uncharacterized protein LOC136043007 n=1 Tax=Artemia franciscana TaxID=6661 RepID=UPI0032DBAC47
YRELSRTVHRDFFEKIDREKIKQEIEVKGAEEVLRLEPFYELESMKGQTEEKPEDRLPKELRKFFIEIETPADILDESINTEITDNLLEAQSAFSSLVEENERMEEEIVETKKKIGNLENERMMLIPVVNAFEEVETRRILNSWLRKIRPLPIISCGRRLSISHHQSSIEYADADPLPEILPSGSHTETTV